MSNKIKDKILAYKKQYTLALLLGAGSVFSASAQQIPSSDKKPFPTEETASPNQKLSSDTISFYAKDLAANSPFINVTYVVDSIPLDPELKEGTAAFTPSRNTITVGNMPTDIPAQERRPKIAHEFWHLRCNSLFLGAKPMSSQQFLDFTEQQEISANLIQVLDIRNEYKNSPDKEKTLNKYKHTLFSFYTNAIKLGLINPDSPSKEAFSDEMRFIGKATKNMWLEARYTGYNFTYSDYVRTLNLPQYTCPEYDKNYQESVSQLYNIGGLDFTKFCNTSPLEKFEDAISAGQAPEMSPLPYYVGTPQYDSLTLKKPSLPQTIQIPNYNADILLKEYNSLSHDPSYKPLNLSTDIADLDKYSLEYLSDRTEETQTPHGCIQVAMPNKCYTLYSEGSYEISGFSNNQKNGKATFSNVWGSTETYSYENNIKQGESLLFSPQGSLLRRSEYTNDEITHHEFYDTSSKKFIPSQNGKNLIEYYPNGNINFSSIETATSGTFCQYNFNGNKLFEQVRAKDHTILFRKTYYPDGLLQQHSLPDKEIYYNKDGTEIAQCTLKDGKPNTGTQISFYENGNIESKTDYLNGEVHGKMIDYYENGQISTSAQLKNGKLHGYYNEFDEEGKLLSSTYYQNGEETTPPQPLPSKER